MYSKRIEKILKAKKISIGDGILVKRGRVAFEGALMPRHEFGDKDCLVIKLDDGYNIGIKFEKGMEIKNRAVSGAVSFSNAKGNVPAKTGAPHPKIKKPDQSRPTVSILHTGGTIASRVDYETGGVVASFGPEDLVGMYPELMKIANIESRLLSNIFSEDMRFEHYQLMAKSVSEEIEKGADGVIITHGTDTLHYTACALAFMLRDLPSPVILVGAQRSSDRGSSDAFLNLTSAARFIAETDFSGVGICMHESLDDKSCLILPACGTRKMHSSRRDAFKPIDSKPIARVGEKIEFMSDYRKRDENRKLKLKLGMEKKVGILKLHPNMDPKIIDAYKNYKGLVLEGTGLGHAPIGHGNEKFFNNLKKLARTCVLVMTTQTIYGRVNMNVYSTGRMLLEIGVIPCSMLPESAFIKLAWLLGNFKKDEAREMMLKNFSEMRQGF
ncbi:MAG: Glu-tRNA(Gln) amidotransferase subunit GatD [Candidatus Aenigmarchaeota archaeon]|nr:Glu-tRNA(Gln) amidotransferase subunit GatD [Candidatus Aenigmarchaeota archaeon]